MKKGVDGKPMGNQMYGIVGMNLYASYRKHFRNEALCQALMVYNRFACFLVKQV